MKKLMVAAAAALTATIGFSVESSNIVGYMNKAAENANSFSWIANTFQKVGGGVVKLSDFSLSESQLPTAVSIFLLGSNGANLKDEGGNSQTFIFVHPARCTTANGWVSGWYYKTKNGTNAAAAEFKKGSESVLWANDYEIPYGSSFGVSRGSGTTTLVFSGAVAAEDGEIEAKNANSFSWLGNVMPVDYKLKDLALKESQLPTAVSLFFLGSNGANLKDEGGNSQTFIFVHPARCTAANGWVSGWYYKTKNGTNAAAAEFKKGTESVLWANEYSVPAGCGFGISRGTGTTTLVVPSPIADAE